MKAVKNKPDPVIASGEDLEQGSYRIAYPNAHGTFNARDVAGTNCAADGSRVITVPVAS